MEKCSYFMFACCFFPPFFLTKKEDLSFAEGNMFKESMYRLMGQR